MSERLADTWASVIDGPLYERNDWLSDLILPILPTPDDLHAEFRAHLHRSIDGVELARAAPCRNLVVVNRDGACEQYERLRLYGVAEFDIVESLSSCGLGKSRGAEAQQARFRDEVVDQVRGGAMRVARLFAERVVEQVVDLRAKRAYLRSVLAEPRLELIVVSVHDAPPMLVGREFDAPLIGISRMNNNVFAAFAAYYFVTPMTFAIGDPAKEIA